MNVQHNAGDTVQNVTYWKQQLLSCDTASGVEYGAMSPTNEMAHHTVKRAPSKIV